MSWTRPLHLRFVDPSWSLHNFLSVQQWIFTSQLPSWAPPPPPLLTPVVIVPPPPFTVSAMMSCWGAAASFRRCNICSLSKQPSLPADAAAAADWVMQFSLPLLLAPQNEPAARREACGGVGGGLATQPVVSLGGGMEASDWCSDYQRWSAGSSGVNLLFWQRQKSATVPSSIKPFQNPAPPTTLHISPSVSITVVQHWLPFSSKYGFCLGSLLPWIHLKSLLLRGCLLFASQLSVFLPILTAGKSCQSNTGEFVTSQYRASSCCEASKFYIEGTSFIDHRPIKKKH